MPLKVVVPLRDRNFGGGAWISTVLSLEAAKGAMARVDMLDAEVEVEWLELELVESDAEGVVKWCGVVICHFGSSSLSFT